MLKRQLEQEMPSPAEIDGYSYKQLFRVGGERGLIDDVEAWFDYRDKRNITSHAYDADKAADIFMTLPAFSSHAGELFKRLATRQQA